MTCEEDLETRRKRLLYRSVYRGNKENDILLGQFARAHIASFGPAELDALYADFLSVLRRPAAEKATWGGPDGWSSSRSRDP